MINETARCGDDYVGARPKFSFLRLQGQTT